MSTYPQRRAKGSDDALVAFALRQQHVVVASWMALVAVVVLAVTVAVAVAVAVLLCAFENLFLIL